MNMFSTKSLFLKFTQSLCVLCVVFSLIKILPLVCIITFIVIYDLYSVESDVKPQINIYAEKVKPAFIVSNGNIKGRSSGTTDTYISKSSNCLGTLVIQNGDWVTMTISAESI